MLQKLAAGDYEESELLKALDARPVFDIDLFPQAHELPPGMLAPSPKLPFSVGGVESPVGGEPTRDVGAEMAARGLAWSIEPADGGSAPEEVEVSETHRLTDPPGPEDVTRIDADTVHDEDLDDAAALGAYGMAAGHERPLTDSDTTDLGTDETREIRPRRAPARPDPRDGESGEGGAIPLADELGVAPESGVTSPQHKRAGDRGPIAEDVYRMRVDAAAAAAGVDPGAPSVILGRPGTSPTALDEAHHGMAAHANIPSLPEFVETSADGIDPGEERLYPLRVVVTTLFLGLGFGLLLGVLLTR